MKILPVEDIIYHWQILRELWDDEDWASLPPHYFTDDGRDWETGPIQPVWWHPNGFPLGEITQAIILVWIWLPRLADR